MFKNSINACENIGNFYREFLKALSIEVAPSRFYAAIHEARMKYGIKDNFSSQMIAEKFENKKLRKIFSVRKRIFEKIDSPLPQFGRKISKKRKFKSVLLRRSR